jgi:hypothetical protein
MVARFPGGPMSEVLERQAVITGVGLSDTGRRLNRTSLSLTVDSDLDAVGQSALRSRSSRTTGNGLRPRA